MEVKRGSLSSGTPQGTCGAGQVGTEWTPLPLGCPSAFADQLAPRRTMEDVQPYYQAPTTEAPQPRHQHLLAAGPYHYSRPPYTAFPQPPSHASAPNHDPGLEGRPWRLDVQAEGLRAPDPFLAAHQARPLHGKKAGGPSFRQYTQGALSPRDEALLKERKARKPGRHICQYCGRACAKPSVLKKHIRSHTGERPFPCIPCGFSFKTKSNLYKHRKSHAHAIKAGLVPALEPGGDGSAPELPSEGDESTDTDEEVRLGGRPSSPAEPHGGSEAYLRPTGGVPEPEESMPPHPPIKVPILIVPGALGGPAAAATAIQNEASASAKAGRGQGPGLGDERGGQRALKQKLALRLSERQGQDSEQSLNLLSPHSKGSTDSGYFSRSESSEQQASPPNTNAKSYAEIIFGKFARLAPRTVVANMAAQDPRPALGLQEKPGLAPVSFPKSDAEKLIRAMGLGEALVEPTTLKSWRFFLPEEEPPACPEVCSLGVPSESSPLVRSNSMPITTGSGLAVPQVLRGSHSFDERMATSDEVCPSASGLSPHQRLLKRQAAIELFPGLEAPSLSDDPEAAHSLPRLSAGVPKDEEVFPSEAEGKVAPACAFECEACGIKYQIWDNFEAHRKFYCAPPQGTKPKALAHWSSGEACPVLPQAPLHPKAGQGSENLPFRKRRKEKSVGDEDELGGDYVSLYSGSSTSLASLCDSRAESLEQEPIARGIVIPVTGPPRGTNGYRYPTHLGFGPIDCPSKAEEREGPSIEEGPAAYETWSASPQACRRPGGNEISVIQHTNSLSRPSSFERSESMEVTPSQPGNASSSSHLEGLRPEQAEACLAGLSQVLVGLSAQPKLVRQHNIQVPEIRVTEEPDKPEKDPEPIAKEPEKVTEEFQWPQRSETLSQLPAEKLPPKKKRLRLAELEYSSGESSFESGPLSRSPSQESNWSHSSSFSLSLDREEGLKTLELGRAPAEYLTVPSGASGLQQKEMRRSASEQTPCQPCMEAAESRSKSFDYGSLSAGQCPPASSPPMAAVRRKCFLVRQATLSQYSEGLQTGLGLEVAEPMQLSQAYHPQALRGRTPSPCAWSPGNEAPLQLQALPAFPGPSRTAALSPYGPWWALPVDAEAWPTEARLQARPGACDRESRQRSSSSPSSPRASPQHCPSRPPQPQLLVPVRIQAHVPSYSSITYTSVSHHALASRRAAPGKAEEQAARGGPGEQARALGARLTPRLDERLEQAPPSGLGLSEASPPAGGSKRVLSPASSLELVLERQRQKRIKEERICGQLMEKLSLQEHSPGRAAKPQLVRQRRTTELRETGPPLSPCEPRPRSAITAEDDSPPSPDLPAQCATSESQPFPSLRGTVAVSWCFLSLAKPNHARQMGPRSSIYASWCISSYNPNPPGTPTKVALALLRSRQAAGPHVYIMAAHTWPTSGKLVASSGWKQRLSQMKWYESSQQGCDRTGRNTAGSLDKEQEKMETGVAKDHGSKIMEPTRIKIFDGGYKSNEDYVYVRGRGRGKYICEECGIRCKKPSMLKKHIRTHTDLRPFMCKFCNFAFKTKGNLTKHMKSKAHTKKCLELGIAITCMYSTDTEETGIPDETEQEALSEVPVLHQFSDPEDTDGAEEEGDEDEDDEDEDEDDRQGDSTPTTSSRSASPLAPGAKPPSSTFSIASASPFDAPHSSSQSSLVSYLVTVPRIQVTQLTPHSYSYAGTALTDYQRQLHNRLMESVEYKDRFVPAANGFWRSQNEDGSSREDSSREMSPSGDTGSSAHPSPVYEGSPGRDTSPTSRRYLSPRRDLSPRPHLSPRREMSPLRHRSPKREGYLSEWSPKQEASPCRHFLPRREIPSPRLASPVNDLSPRRDASPRRDYRERRHMPSLRTTSPRRGSFQSEHAMGHFVQHSDINLRQSQQNLFDTSRATAWSWYSDNAQGDQTHSLLSEAQTSCLFTHLPLHSQQQVRAPYHMIPIGGIQMVQTGASAFPGILPASQLPLRRRRREESIIDEATHCVIESIKEMDIFSKAEETPAPSPMAISPPRPNAAEGMPGTAQFGERERGPGEDQASQRLLDQARAYAAHPRADGATEAFQRPHPPENDRGREKAAYQPQRSEPSGGSGPCHDETSPSFLRQQAEVHIGGEGSLDSRPGNPNRTR